jgi:hypothetical protein
MLEGDKPSRTNMDCFPDWTASSLAQPVQKPLRLLGPRKDGHLVGLPSVHDPGALGSHRAIGGHIGRIGRIPREFPYILSGSFPKIASDASIRPIDCDTLARASGASRSRRLRQPGWRRHGALSESSMRETESSEAKVSGFRSRLM